MSLVGEEIITVSFKRSELQQRRVFFLTLMFLPVYYSAAEQSYIFNGTVIEDADDNPTRLLRSSMSIADEEASLFETIGKAFIPSKTIEVDPIVLTHGPRNLAQDPDGHILHAHQCFCARGEETFCPVGARLCRIKSTTVTYKVHCEGPTQDKFAMFMFPFVVFVIVFLGCLLFTTTKGKYALGYIRKMLLCWSEERYETFCYNELDRMHQREMRRRAYIQRMMRDPNRIYYGHNHTSIAQLENNHRQREGIDAAPAPPLVSVANRRAVLLKTRKYGEGDGEGADESILDHNAVKDASDEHDHRDLCSICLQEFEQGDRVGDLPCGHVFHANCLKTWIQRKNHCPLCQADNLALPRNNDNHGNNDGINTVEGVEMANLDSSRTTTGSSTEPSSAADSVANSPTVV